MKFNSEKGNEAVSFVCVSVFFFTIEFVMFFFFLTDSWNSTAFCRKRLSFQSDDPPTAGLLGLVSCDPGGLW